MARVLLLGSDRQRAAALRGMLSRDGHQVSWLRSVESWPAHEREAQPDLVVAAVGQAEPVLAGAQSRTGRFPPPLLFVQNETDYAFLVENLTAERVKEHFKDICKGDVVRFEAPNMLALNFLLSDSLGGGGSESLLTDAQGKTHGLALLEMELER